MGFATPHDTIVQLLAARARGDIRTALACYEPDATVVIEPGKLGRGTAAIEALTRHTITLPIIFGEHEIIEGGGVALNLLQWRLRPPCGTEITGRTTDVLRRQVDGSWLMAIDNAWGTFP